MAAVAEPSLSPASFIRDAVDATLEDESFTTGSEVAARALGAAETLKCWCEDKSNEIPYTEFSEQLLKELKETIPPDMTVNRERIWRSFFNLRSSSAFSSMWRTFLHQAGITPTPILYQHLTDWIFRKLIQNHFSYSSTSQSATPGTSIDEGNALRYAAGYVVRHVMKKIWASNPVHKDDLLSCCQSLLRMYSTSDSQNTAEEWTNLVDRGGLFHVKETTFQLFVALEDEVRKYLGQLSSPHSLAQKAQFLKSLCRCDDVQFYWCISAADFEVVDTDVHEHVLKMVVDLFLTIRGFSYASAWIENYKQVHKKSTQRSKGLRKRLYTDLTM